MTARPRRRRGLGGASPSARRWWGSRLARMVRIFCTCTRAAARNPAIRAAQCAARRQRARTGSGKPDSWPATDVGTGSTTPRSGTPSAPSAPAPRPRLLLNLAEPASQRADRRPQNAARTRPDAAASHTRDFRYTPIDVPNTVVYGTGPHSSPGKDSTAMASNAIESRAGGVGTGGRGSANSPYPAGHADEVRGRARRRTSSCLSGFGPGPLRGAVGRSSRPR